LEPISNEHLLSALAFIRSVEMSDGNLCALWGLLAGRKFVA
jgi:hypothetical protein